MSETQNVETIRRGYDAFGRGDIQGLLALLDPQISWITPGPSDLPTAGTRRGHAAVGEFFQTLSGLGDVLEFEPMEFIAQGDRVVVLGTDSMRLKATGRDIAYRWAHVFTVKEGLVTAFEEVGDVSALVAELRGSQAGV